MAEKKIKTKILLRYDVLSAWNEANPTLQKGEVAIVAIPANSNELNINGTTPPQILFKVGPGEFKKLPYASGKAADVYSWAKAEKLTIAKSGNGNVVSGIEWDASANEGKGGIKFTTTSVATSESLENVQDRLTVIEGTGEKSRITLLEEGLAATDKLIAESKATWEKDDNTTYTFEAVEKGFKVTPSIGEGKTITFDYLTAKEVADAITTYGYQNAEDVQGIVEDYLESYYTKTEIDNKGFLVASDIADKADKSYVDTELAKKADKSYVDTELAKKADASALDSYYTKTEINETVGEINEAIGLIEGDIEDLVGENGEIATIKGNITDLTTNKADKTELASYETVANADLVRGRVSTLEDHFKTGGRVTEAESKIATLETTVGNLSGAFQFQGTKATVEELPAASPANKGHVYVVGSKEYASDGLKWILLGDEGSYVLKTTYEAHLKTQEAVDKGQSDKIEAIEKNIAEHSADWAKKTSVTDPTAGDGKIIVDETEITVYDDSKLVARVTKVENEFKEVDGVKGKVLAIEGKVDGVIADYLKGADKTELEGKINDKQDIITDLAAIRSGAALGATAVQPSDIEDMLTETDAAKTYATKDEVKDAIANEHTHINKAILDATTESFTTELKSTYDGYAGSISGVADRVTAVENEFKTVEGVKGTVVELKEKVSALEAKPDITVTSTSVSDGTNTFTKYDDKALSDRVKVVEDNFADWAIIWDCGGAN